MYLWKTVIFMEWNYHIDFSSRYLKSIEWLNPSKVTWMSKLSVNIFFNIYKTNNTTKLWLFTSWQWSNYSLKEAFDQSPQYFLQVIIKCSQCCENALQNKTYLIRIISHKVYIYMYIDKYYRGLKRRVYDNRT